MLKDSIKRALRHANAELLRYYQGEKELIESHPGMTLRDALRVQALATEGQVSVTESRFLGELVRRSDPARPIVEIGTLFGHSTLVLAANKARGQPLITVDNYSWNPLGLSPAAHQLATRLKLAEAVAEHNTTILAMSAKEFYRSYSAPRPRCFSVMRITRTRRSWPTCDGRWTPAATQTPPPVATPNSSTLSELRRA